MNNRMVTKEDERLVSLFRVVDELSEMIENIVCNPRIKLGNEQYLTDKDLSRLLKISRRSLQDYRTEGKIPFYRVGGKILYQASDIEDFLSKRHEKLNNQFTNT